MSRHTTPLVRQGVTLIELLVLVAVIGVLAMMLVPLFEARRDEARNLGCQSNVQHIVTAIRMYMEDHGGALPPEEHRPEVLAYFNTGPGGRDWHGDSDCPRARQANPFLRWPVIFDSYVSSRAVWQCPSARLIGGAGWIIPDQDWLSYLQAREGLWGTGTDYLPCMCAWPAGWGGSVTDSIAQGRLAIAFPGPENTQPVAGAFRQSLGTTYWPSLTLSEVTDPSSFVIAGDAGASTQALGLGVAAYPDVCRLECSNPCCGGADWENCPWTRLCGVPGDGSYLSNISQRVPVARHRGRFAPGLAPWQRNGVNIGFLDGHVRWIASEDLIDKVAAGEYEGLEAWGPTSDDDWSGGYLTENGWVIY